MKALRDRVRGCLLGGAIGDALGAPVENWHWRDIRRQHGQITEFLPQPARSRDGGPGQVTDDTTLRQYLCLTLVENEGRIGPDEYASGWLRHMNPDRVFVTERMVLEKLRLGMSPWDTGRGQLSADAAIMSIQPVGIVNLGDPIQAYRDAVSLAGLHQDGIERDAAATIAAGISVALLPGAGASEVVATMERHATYDVRRLVHTGVSLARDAGSFDELAQRFYETSLDQTFPTPVGEDWDPERSVAATSREVLPAVVAVLLSCPHDPGQALVWAAGLGRDADTIATVTGCFAGAIHGADALRLSWRTDVEAANTDFFTELSGDPDSGFAVMADRLVETIGHVREKTSRRLAQLDRLLLA